MRIRRHRVAVVVFASVLALAAALVGSGAAGAAAPVGQTAPYEYLGWGNPQAPTTVMSTTGIHDVTLAFMLSRKTCDPAWDGNRALTGGADQAAINQIRAAGGDVLVSFGGWSGRKLGTKCKTAAALTGAYTKVVNTYALRAIDIDIEHAEYTNNKTRARVIAALAALHHAKPALEIYVTFGTTTTGPDATGKSMIAAAAAAGFQPTAWTIMPFDFGSPVADMGQTSVRAAQGLAQTIVSTYHVSPAVAYQHSGISSMNGRTDDAGATVSPANFQTILTFAQQQHLGRLTFWSVNRDRPCGGANTSADACSGISQAPYAFTKLLADYTG